MAKDFLKLKNEQKVLKYGILGGGIAVSVLMGVLAYRDTALENGYELERREAGESAYSEALTAEIEDEKFSLSVTVDARRLSKKEAEQELLNAEKLLDDILKGSNESFSCITEDLNFPEMVEGTLAEVEWTEKLSDYFTADGMWREEIELSEPVEVRAAAILSCQEAVKDYEAVLTLMPRTMKTETALSLLIEESDQKSAESRQMVLPTEYHGKTIVWKRKMDGSFLYFLVLIAAAQTFLKFGEKRDEEQLKKKRLVQMESDYAGVVSKFAMLLAAGLSVRNAWERIVFLGGRNEAGERAVYEEMNRTLKEMQKGVSELEAYEAFGKRVGQIHYKKLMALFVSHKKRGSIDLIDAMNREMLQAWEEQKQQTRQQGEKIGTKLLLPMMGMLAVVFVIILVPAFLSF